MKHVINELRITLFEGEKELNRLKNEIYELDFTDLPEEAIEAIQTALFEIRLNNDGLTEAIGELVQNRQEVSESDPDLAQFIGEVILTFDRVRSTTNTIIQYIEERVES